MPVTRHPSHRSQHALLTHWAPALGSGVKAVQRLRMKNTNRRKEALQQNFKSLPRHTVALASSPKRSQPIPLYMLEEIIQTWPIAGHRIIVQVPLQDSFQPLSCFLYRLMQTPAQFLFDRLNLPLDTFLYGFTTYLKPAFPCLGAIVSKTQKVKCFWFLLASRATFFSRIATKTDESGFVGMER